MGLSVRQDLQHESVNVRQHAIIRIESGQTLGSSTAEDRYPNTRYACESSCIAFTGLEEWVCVLFIVLWGK
jgi:hypothetical protein